MKKITIENYTNLHVNTSVEGESIETKIQRIVGNKEPIKDGAPILYTERKDGVRPETDIRTDRFEIALDAMTIVDATHQAKRLERLKEQKTSENLKKGLDAEGKPIQGTTDNIAS